MLSQLLLSSFRLVQLGLLFRRQQRHNFFASTGALFAQFLAKFDHLLFGFLIQTCSISSRCSQRLHFLDQRFSPLARVRENRLHLYLLIRSQKPSYLSESSTTSSAGEFSALTKSW